MTITHINNRYLLRDRLGIGGMGVVCLALDRLTQEEVALKQVQVPTSNLYFMSRPSSGQVQDLRIALAHEFQTLASLRHPHVISVLDYGFDQTGQPFYTMTYLPEAENLLVVGARLPFEEKIRFVQEMFRALAYLHRRGVLHRDLKPDNLLVSENRLHVLDFGLAIAQADGDTASSSGTLTYWAPEQWMQQPFVVATDLFSAGIIAFELLIGEHPFGPVDSFLMDRVLDEPPKSDSLNSLGKLKPIFEKLLHKSLNNRYQTANEVLHDLSELLGKGADQESVAIREGFLQAATFVGREPEMAQLKEALVQAKSGEGCGWLIGGESGVGKSRLLDEFRSHALVEGWQVLIGQAVEGGGVPYQLWQEVIPKLVLNQPLDKLEAAVLRQIVPNIAMLVDSNIPVPPKLDGRAYQQRVTNTIVSLVRQQSQPTLLIFEDLQWASESLEPIKQLLKLIDDTSGVMIIGTYRNDERPELPSLLAGSRTIELDRLPNHQIGELCQKILGEEAATKQMIDLLAAQTEGNTFFIVEVMRAWAEEAGYLENIGGIDLPTKILTSGMQNLLQRRIERVPIADRPLLRLAAVAGRALDEKLLGELAVQSRVSQLNSWLQRVSDGAIIVVQDNEWRFAHDKLCEAILLQLDQTDLAALHRQVAETLEQLYPGRSELDASLLEHWHHVGDFDKEYDYLTSVTDRLIRLTADYQAAVELIERLLKRLPTDDPRQVSLWNWSAAASWRRGEFDRAAEMGQRALEMATEVGERSGLATSLRELATVAHHQGDYQFAVQHYQKALDIWTDLDDQDELARIYSLKGSLAGAQGKFPLAEQFLSKSLSIRKAKGDRYYIASVLTNLGMVAFFQEGYVKAQELYGQSLEISREIGDLFGIALNLNNLGSVQYHQAQFFDAQQSYEESLSIYRKTGQQNGVTMCLINLGFVYLNQKNPAAQSTLLEALTGAHQAQIKPFMMELIVGFAWLFLQQGELDEAWTLVQFAELEAEQYVDVQIRLDELRPLLSGEEVEKPAKPGDPSADQFELDSIVKRLFNRFSEAF